MHLIPRLSLGEFSIRKDWWRLLTLDILISGSTWRHTRILWNHVFDTASSLYWHETLYTVPHTSARWGELRRSDIKPPEALNSLDMTTHTPHPSTINLWGWQLLQTSNPWICLDNGLSYRKLSPLLVRAWAPNPGQSLVTAMRAAHHSATCIEPTNIVNYPPKSSAVNSALLIESTCLKECHSHLKADFFSFFFLQRAFVVFICPISSDPEHWLPGPFFSFFIFYTILIFCTIFTLKRAVLFEILPCYGFPRILQLLTVYLSPVDLISLFNRYLQQTQL